MSGSVEHTCNQIAMTMPVAAAGKVPMCFFFFGGGGVFDGLAFLGLKSSKEEELTALKSPEQAGRGALDATCSSQNDISHFSNLSTSSRKRGRERKKISRPLHGMYWRFIFEHTHTHTRTCRYLCL